MTNYDILKEYEAHKTPVPSYEEWRRLQSSWVDEMGKAIDLQKALEWSNEQYNTKVPVLESENQRLQMSLRMTVDDYKNVVDICEQLKELLKECRVYVENCEQFNQYDLDMLGKIDNAIGEKK